MNDTIDDRDTDTDTNASTACSANELLSGAGSCVDYSGWDQDAGDDFTTESDPLWSANVTTCASGNHLFFNAGSLDCEADDDEPDDDSEVPNDITIDSTKWINTTEGMAVGSGKKICLNGEATCTSYIWYNGSATVIV
jgi:hypothetical protein